MNSVKRFYINQFTDGYHQDALDFLTAKITGTELSEKRAGVGFMNSFMMLLAIFAVYFFVVNRVVKKSVGVVEEPTETEETSFIARLAHLIIMGVSVIVFQKIIVKMNKKFVDLPTKK